MKTYNLITIIGVVIIFLFSGVGSANTVSVEANNRYLKQSIKYIRQAIRSASDGDKESTINNIQRSINALEKIKINDNSESDLKLQSVQKIIESAKVEINGDNYKEASKYLKKAYRIIHTLEIGDPCNIDPSLPVCRK